MMKNDGIDKASWLCYPKHRMSFVARWVTLSLLIFCVLLMGLAFAERIAVEIIDMMLTPWMRLCSVLTPQEWQTRGNILLGMAWIISGALFYALCIGGGLALAYSLLVFRRSGKDNARKSE